MAEIKTILEKIENLRQALTDLYNAQGSINQEVLEKSKELDEELNRFYRLIKKSPGNNRATETLTFASVALSYLSSLK